MQDTVFIQPDVAEAITDVLIELSTELDLHYEDEELVVVAPTIAKMQRLAGLLVESGHGLPEEYTHILTRFNKAFN